MGDAARLQITAGQMGLAVEQAERIDAELKKYYSAVLLDLEARHEQ